MVRAVKGVLVECDPSIKAIILKIDQERHEYIVEDLDEQTLVIKDNKLQELKEKLDEALADTQMMPEDSESDA
ncbi:MAG: TFIIH complex subunit tfb5 [Cirrosporium novae-zelandiae]|nr:MAG: TFIIH complex subunit tfb5 [Cirrosporium novae-zelandiae]KAI9736023.1 MAG: TFIIH complex subunit tfb5 [Cirrosporium novae-zelandiae]